MQVSPQDGIYHRMFSNTSPQELLEPGRWKLLAQQFHYDNYRLHQLGSDSVLAVTLQCGLSAIKTSYPQFAMFTHLLSS